MAEPFDYHTSFHQILGRVTTIRSACSVLAEDYGDKLPENAAQMIKIMNEHAAKLVDELKELRDQMYSVIDKEQNTSNLKS